MRKIIAKGIFCKIASVRATKTAGNHQPEAAMSIKSNDPTLPQTKISNHLR
jgi:hypothetical protein